MRIYFAEKSRLAHQKLFVKFIFVASPKLVLKRIFSLELLCIDSILVFRVMIYRMLLVSTPQTNVNTRFLFGTIIFSFQQKIKKPTKSSYFYEYHNLANSYNLSSVCALIPRFKKLVQFYVNGPVCVYFDMVDVLFFLLYEKNVTVYLNLG